MSWLSCSQSELRGSQEIRDQFPGYLWIHFRNGYFEIYLFMQLKKYCFVKNNRGNPLSGDMFISYDR
jgi:hypothetical protein